MSHFYMLMQQIFDWVIRGSLMASILVILVLIVQFLMKDKLKPRWKYILWLPVAIRLLLPWAPESTLSLYNLLPVDETATTLQQQDRWSLPWMDPGKKAGQLSPNNNLQTTDSRVVGSSTTANASAETSIREKTGIKEFLVMSWTYVSQLSLREVVMYAWLAGILMIGTVTVLANIRMQRSIRKEPVILSPSLSELFQESQAIMKVKQRVRFVATDCIPGPAVLGFLKPVIVISPSLLNSLNRDQLRYILAHEFAHIRRRDVAVNWSIHALLLINWFNPILWIALFRVRQDQELACDAFALTHLHSDQINAYGRTIIHVLEHYSGRSRQPGLAGLSATHKQMKRRLLMIKQFNKKSYGLSILGLSAVIALGSTTLVNAKGTEAEAAPKAAYTNINQAAKLSVLNQLYNLRPDLREYRCEYQTGSYSQSGSSGLLFVSFQKNGKERAQAVAKGETIISFKDNELKNAANTQTSSSHVLMQKAESITESLMGTRYKDYHFKAGMAPGSNSVVRLTGVVNQIQMAEPVEVELTADYKMGSYFSSISVQAIDQYPDPSQAKDVKEVISNMASLMKLVYVDAGQGRMKPVYIPDYYDIDATTGTDVRETMKGISEKPEPSQTVKIKSGEGRRLIAHSSGEVEAILKQYFHLSGVSLIQDKTVAPGLAYVTEDGGTRVLMKNQNEILAVEINRNSNDSSGSKPVISLEKSKQTAIDFIQPLLDKSVDEIHIAAATGKGVEMEFMIYPSYKGIPVEDNSYQIIVDRSTGKIKQYSGINGGTIHSFDVPASIISKETAATRFVQKFPLKLMYSTMFDGANKPVLIYAADRIHDAVDQRHQVDAVTGQIESRSDY